jgi:trehalose 6-phosphate synthase/phosphatase
MNEAGKLIVCSTRLPVRISRKADGWQAVPNPGGLVTALQSVAERHDFEWIGWAGTHVNDADRGQVTAKLGARGYRPIYLNKPDIEGFYGGFSNRVLWPLFHGMAAMSTFRQSYWKSYQKVNNLFADEICRHAQKQDLIWIHDYQLALVPELLRQRGVTCSIGYFLHVPFPSSEIYRTLPVREEVLRGILGADFVAFHAYEYVSHFKKACLRVLGMDGSHEVVRAGSRRVRLGVLPIGIDPTEIREMATTPEAVAELTKLNSAYRGKKLILGVDRLDYTKGIPEKLLAFEELLRTNPKWRSRCVLMQIAAPSRESVDEYQALRRRVDELVGHINGTYGSPDHTPIVYINQAVDRKRLVGMYQAADVALITPIRDGMNLVALEYIAARGQQGGSLILSEFAGAAYLLPGARLVNPYNVTDVAQTIGEELEQSSADPTHMLQFVNENTSMSWANRFLDQLEGTAHEVRPAAQRLRVDEPPAVHRLRHAKKPLVLLDYDGTLRGYERKPSDAVPNARIRGMLRSLAEVATVYVISGRDANVLEKWLGDLPIGLVCEHGLSIRQVHGQWEDRKISAAAGLRRVEPLFEEFRKRTPGAIVERKRSSIAWHYRSADPELATVQVNELLNQLEEVLRRRPFSILRGNRVVEVRHTSATKGHAVLELLRRHTDADALFCAGDDRTDEDMMEEISRRWGDRAVLCWVGGRSPMAEFWTQSTEHLVSQLSRLGQMWAEERLKGRTSLVSPRRKAAPHAKAQASRRAHPSDAEASSANNAPPKRAAGKESTKRANNGAHSPAQRSDRASKKSKARALRSAKAHNSG